MTFGEALTSGMHLILDGGMGSALIAKGLRSGTAPELWNLERPADIVEVHRRYVEAGSDAVQTNTFGGNPLRLEAVGVAGRCEEINRAGVELARQASPRFVVGDIGPTGEYLPPVGHGDEARWRVAFERQARALAAAGVDAFHIETMSDIREARVALEAVLLVAPGVSAMVSMTFEKKKRGFFTVMGNALVASMNELSEAGALAVGANCSLASGDMRDLVEEALAGVHVPLVIQPNAGNPSTVDGKVLYAQMPDEFADDMATVAALGVRVLGGCCGTDDRFVAALRRRLEAPS